MTKYCISNISLDFVNEKIIAGGEGFQVIETTFKDRYGNVEIRRVCSCHGSLHSPGENIPAAVEIYGNEITKYWFRHGKNFRERDLPCKIVRDKALSYNHIEEWFDNNYRLNRITGPARIERTHNSTSCQYFISGKELTKEQFVWRYEMTFLKPYKGM